MSKRGRPKGRKNLQRAFVIVELPRCPNCQSTDRTPYLGNQLTKQIVTKTPAGQTFNRIVYKRCQCTSCGESLTHVVYANV